MEMRSSHWASAAALALAAGVLASGQGRAPTHDEFWSRLRTLCGRAFEGRLLDAPAGDTTFTGTRLIMHVRSCQPNVIEIPVHVGEDRSRTWVLTRHASGLRLKHDHRHQDGSEEEITQYGGDTTSSGTSERQEFFADAHTAALIPAARTNVWIVEVEMGRVFAYTLRRDGTDRRFRLEFDIAQPVEPPPAPWGDK
jgi:hypothetical protein